MPGTAPDSLATNFYSVYPEDYMKDSAYDSGYQHCFLSSTGVLPRKGTRNATYVMDPGGATGFMQNGGLLSARMPTVGTWTGAHLGFNKCGAHNPPFFYSYQNVAMDARTMTIYAVVNKCASYRITDGTSQTSDTGVDEVFVAFGKAGGSNYVAIAVDHVTGCWLIKITSGATYNTGIPATVNNQALVITFANAGVTITDQTGLTYTSATGTSNSATDVDLIYFGRAFASDSGFWGGAIKYLAVNAGTADTTQQKANAMTWMVATYNCQTSYASTTILEGDSNMCGEGAVGAHTYALARAMLQPTVQFLIRAWRGMYAWQLTDTRASALRTYLGAGLGKPCDVEVKICTNDQWNVACESGSLYSTYAATAGVGGGAVAGTYTSNMWAVCCPQFINEYAKSARKYGIRRVLVNSVLPNVFLDYSSEIQSITGAAGTATVTTKLAHNLTTGNIIRVYGSNVQGYNVVTGAITVTGATTFTFANATTTTAVATGKVTKFNTLAGTADQEVAREDGHDAGTVNGIPTLNNGRQQLNTALAASAAAGCFAFINHDLTHFPPRIPTGGTVGDWVQWQVRNNPLMRRTRMNNSAVTQDHSQQTTQTGLNIATDLIGHYDGNHAAGDPQAMAAAATVVQLTAVYSATVLRNRNSNP